MKKIVLLTILVFFALSSNFAQGEIKFYPQMGHHHAITGLGQTPDGRFLVSSSRDDSIRLWHLSSGKEIRSILPGEVMYATSIDPSGTSILAAGQGPRRIIRYDLVTGRIIRSYDGPSEEIKCLAWSRDGSLFAAGYLDQTIRIWDAVSGEYLYQFNGHEQWITSLVWSADGKSLFSASADGIVKIWNVAVGTARDLAKKAPLWAGPLAISPDGDHLAVGYGKAGLYLYDLASNKTLWDIPPDIHGQIQVLSIDFSPDGKELAAGYTSKKTIVYNTDTGSLKKEDYCYDLNGGVMSLKWSLDGKSIFTGDGSGIIRRLDREGMELLSEYQGKGSAVATVVFSPDNRYLASASGGEGIIRIWDLFTGSPVFPLAKGKARVECLAFSPDGKILLSGDWNGTLVFWDWQRGVKLCEMPTGNTATILDIQYAPDGKSVFLLRSQGNLLQVSASKQAIIKDYGNLGNLKKFDITPDSKTIVAVAWNDGIIRIDTVSGKLDKVLKDWGSFDSVELSPDGQLAATGTANGILYLWNIKTGKQVKRIVAHGNGVIGGNNTGTPIGNLTWTSDGKGILTGGTDGLLRLWDPVSGEKKREWSGHSSAIETVGCSRDGKWIASGSLDTTIRLVNINNGALIILAGGIKNNSNQWLSRTEDGYWDGSRDCGSLVSMVRENEVWNIDQFATRNNRPDIILTRMESPDTERIENLASLYRRRLRRLGIAEESLSQQIPVPTTELTGAKQDNKFVALQLSFKDFSSPLIRYQVYVNDVPLFGAMGKPLKGKSASVTERIELTSGGNKVEISCLNGAGLESWRSTAFFRYDIPVIPDLYFLAFGVSTYADPAITDLGFAAKDALDLEKSFKLMQGQSFRKVYSRVYTDSQVTRQALQDAADFVKAARVDDLFVLFIAGHGTYIRGKEPVYYYVSSDARLAELTATAVPFETVEALLQGISPRKKLFLMDTCESGDADWGVPSAANNDVAVRGLSARTINPATLRGLKVLGRSAPAVEERERFLSNDLVRRSGAIVFSSSQGNEYSLESAEWQQGAFTKEILRAFQTPAADLDHDGILSIREIQHFVSGEVPKLTGERQHPTVDRDNIYIDFGFPVK